MTPRGAINAWKCDTCAQLLVAVHVDEGVTPMLLACRETAGCSGTMVSSGYPSSPIPESVLARLSWEWHKASVTQLKQWKRERNPMYEHCQMGGLVLDWLTDAGREAMAEASS